MLVIRTHTHTRSLNIIHQIANRTNKLNSKTLKGKVKKQGKTRKGGKRKEEGERRKEKQDARRDVEGGGRKKD